MAPVASQRRQTIPAGSCFGAPEMIVEPAVSQRDKRHRPEARQHLRLDRAAQPGGREIRRGEGRSLEQPPRVAGGDACPRRSACGTLLRAAPTARRLSPAGCFIPFSTYFPDSRRKLPCCINRLLSGSTEKSGDYTGFLRRSDRFFGHPPGFSGDSDGFLRRPSRPRNRALRPPDCFRPRRMNRAPRQPLLTPADLAERMPEKDPRTIRRDLEAQRWPVVELGERTRRVRRRARALDARRARATLPPRPRRQSDEPTCSAVGRASPDSSRTAASA